MFDKNVTYLFNKNTLFSLDINNLEYKAPSYAFTMFNIEIDTCRWSLHGHYEETWEQREQG